MSMDGYQTRQDILHDHVQHIQDLGKDNAALTVLLEIAQSEITALKLEVEQIKAKLAAIDFK